MGSRLRHHAERALESIARAFAISNYRPAGQIPDLAEWFFGTPFGLTDQQLQHGDAYRQIPIIHGLVNLIASDCASLPRKFYDGERELDPKKFMTPAQVFASGNDRQTGLEVRTNLFSDMELYARAHVFVEFGRGVTARPNRPPFAIWTLHPPMVKMVPGRGRTIDEYIWYGAGEPQSIPAWKVITIQKYGPDVSDLNPASWVESAREDWMAQYYALRILRQYYMRGGMSPGTWSIEGQGKPPLDEDIKKWQRNYMARFQNLESLWTPKFMVAMKQVEKGQTISELQISEMLTTMNADCCRAAQVPPWMLGIKEAGSLDQGKSSETSTEIYWRSKIGNLCALVDAVLNERFCPLFGENVEMETDFDGVPALQESRLELLKGAVIAAGDAVISVNEVRSWVGYEETGRPEDDLPRMTKAAPPPNSQPGQQPGDEPAPEADSNVEPAAASASVTNGHHARRVPLSDASRRQRLKRLQGKQERRLVREEQKMAALWRSIRDQQEEYAIDALHQVEQKGFSAMDRIDVDPDRLYPGVTDAQKEQLRRRIEDTMAIAGEAAADEIGSEIGIIINSLAVQSYVQGRTNVMIDHVTSTDRKLLRKKIGEAVAAGKQWREIEAIVREFFDDRRDNSMTIARTEVAGPYNRAQFETWKAGGVRRKWWMTLRDDAVRHTHEAAGETYTESASIGIDEHFQVGSGSCTVPGETGLAEEDINCRCQVMPDLEGFDAGIRASHWPARSRIFSRKTVQVSANSNGVLQRILGAANGR